MPNVKVHIKTVFQYWHEEAEYAWDVAESLFGSGKYPEALFFGHLALEKLLKAIIVVGTKEHAPRIHNLVKLSNVAELSIGKEDKELLRRFSDFHIAGRYDEEKRAFRKKCTKRFTEENILLMKKMYLWLKKDAEKLFRLK